MSSFLWKPDFFCRNLNFSIGSSTLSTSEEIDYGFANKKKTVRVRYLTNALQIGNDKTWSNLGHPAPFSVHSRIHCPIGSLRNGGGIVWTTVWRIWRDFYPPLRYAKGAGGSRRPKLWSWPSRIFGIWNPMSARMVVCSFPILLPINTMSTESWFEFIIWHVCI